MSLAYSPVARQFLLAWVTCCLAPSAKVVRLDLFGQPVGSGVPVSAATGFRSLNGEFSFTNNTVDVVWNGVSGEFGVTYEDLTGLALARVRIDGTIAGRLPYMNQRLDRNFWSAIDVNPFFGNYVVAWAATVGPGPYGVASIDSSGVLISEAVGPPDGSSYSGIDVVFSRATGTFLLVRQFTALELRADGTLTASQQSWNLWRGQAVALPGGSWMVRGYQSVSTIASATRSGGCVTPNPFGSGGNCYNGGWLPPGVPVPPAPPPKPSPAPGGCTTPDPFTTLGGGTCVNGGWLPPAQPPPPPPPVGCITPDPFVSIPGMAGICINGGWHPTQLVTVTGTLRYFYASEDVWAIDAGNNVRYQLSAPPPLGYRVDGIPITVTAKVRWDLPLLDGYVQVLEITTITFPFTGLN